MIQKKQQTPLPLVIKHIEQLHFKVITLDNGKYIIWNTDGTYLFDCEVTMLALRRFEEVASQYRRRNGLKKLYEQLPEMVKNIKNNPWFWQ